MNNLDEPVARLYFFFLSFLPASREFVSCVSWSLSKSNKKKNYESLAALLFYWYFEMWIISLVSSRRVESSCHTSHITHQSLWSTHALSEEKQLLIIFNETFELCTIWCVSDVAAMFAIPLGEVWWASKRIVETWEGNVGFTGVKSRKISTKVVHLLKSKKIRSKIEFNPLTHIHLPYQSDQLYQNKSNEAVAYCRL